jgi:PEP-CTERM putative exosortase interaction domain
MKTPTFGFRTLWLASAAALACAAAVVVAPRPAQAQELITNGGFESGFTGWTREDQTGSDGTFFLQTGTESPLNGFPVPTPPEGANAAMTDAGAGGSHVLYQDFVVPVGMTTGTLSFSLFLNSGAEFVTPENLDWAATNPFGGQNLNQQARVDLLLATADPFSVAAGDILLNVFQTAPTDPLTSGYADFSVDVSAVLAAHQGQTLRLRFAEVDNISFLNLGVDRVSLGATAVVPEPASLLLMLTGGGVLLGSARLVRRRCQREA